MSQALSLPIDAHLDQIVEMVRSHPMSLLQSPPGTGKTTRVPPALMQAFPQSQVHVLEPRRLAARWSAHTIAKLHGDLVGYQVRFEDRTTPHTRLIFMTAGVFTRRLLSDPELEKAAVVVLDEFHERSLENDLALAWIRMLQARGRGPRVLIMSATLPVQLSTELDAPALDCPAPLYPVEVRHLGSADPSLENRVLAAMSEAGTRQRGQHTLVFLPGMAEIRACQQKLATLAQKRGAELKILHGSLTTAEQDEVLQPFEDRCRWILSTNIAETSLTIAGVRVVVDSGLARQSVQRTDTSTPVLETARISQFSARQRTGRAGRTGPGLCLRLYSEADFLARPESDPPEIARTDLSGLALQLQVMGVSSLPWLAPPPPPLWEAARQLLTRLGALADGELTALGRRMAQLPLSPRLARLVLACPGADGLAAAALLSERTPLTGGKAAEIGQIVHRASDLPVVHQLRRMVPNGPAIPLSQALLAAFPDRVAQLRRGRDLLLCDGQAWPVPALSEVPDGWILALDLEQNWAARTAHLRLYSPIEPEWLLERPEISEDVRYEWNAQLGRVEQVERIVYGQLALDESRKVALPGPGPARILAREAKNSAWWRGIQEDFASLQARLELLSQWENSGNLDPDSFLQEVCQEHVSLHALARLKAFDVLPANIKRSLDRLCPLYVELGRKRVKVHYEPGRPAWIEAKLVDFFNLREGPRIGGGRMPLTLHLLAPNHRPVQVTSDLAGFWERHYPKVKQELKRKYPRHPWPDDPLNAPADWRPTRK